MEEDIVRGKEGMEHRSWRCYLGGLWVRWDRDLTAGSTVPVNSGA